MYLLFVVVAVAVVAVSGAPAAGCHNATGACLASGYVCATGQVLEHHKRCNGVEDCVDGTDEYLCNDPDPSPVFLRTGKDRRRALAQSQSSCAYCTCFTRDLVITNTDPLFPAAVRTYLDPSGLLTGGSGIFAGQPCNHLQTVTLTVRMYKKAFFCRGPVCCIRQLTCNVCTGSFSFLKRCFEV